MHKMYDPCALNSTSFIGYVEASFEVVFKVDKRVIGWNPDTTRCNQPIQEREIQTSGVDSNIKQCSMGEGLMEIEDPSKPMSVTSGKISQIHK